MNGPLDPDIPASAAASAPEPEALLAGLNPEQREAVTHEGGPLLVLAGAGSGKTRVITHRIAWLVLAHGVWPSRIVAVTFTNKAAAEMRGRVEALLGVAAAGAWVGTFHSLCLRILRQYGERIGLDRRFNVYDTDDQVSVVKRLLLAEVGDNSPLTPRAVLSRISRAKNAMESAEAMAQRAFNPDRKLVARIYAAYETELRKAQAVDFDDLLLRTLELFRNCPDVAAERAERCEHLLVDEYQDTNRPQYHLVRALSAAHHNAFVVGDEDQSIYRFRGAELRNILEFEDDHDGTRVIRLEQNYRSTGTILDAAGAVVAHNVGRKGKTLWTENGRGEPLELIRAPDDRAEALWVARRVRELEANCALEDMAVLYRTNAQSRLLEELFRRDRIPYQVVGAVQFYGRKEIKDLLSYLRLATNPADDVAFLRIVNTPPRGIGATTVAAIEAVAQSDGVALTAAAARAIERQIVTGRASRSLAQFLELLADISERGRNAVAPTLEHLIETLGYEDYLDKAYPGGLSTERKENVRALVSAAAEYEEEVEEASLQGFLDRSALVSDVDNLGARPGVTLMTVHCAKGLEFTVVFLAGLEENLFPHAMSQGSDDDVEEERRLCYVAMTRARRRLVLSYAGFRRVQGVPLPARPSRFLQEIPTRLLRAADPPPDLWQAYDAAGAPSRYGSSAARSTAARPATRRSEPPRSTVRVGDGFDVGGRVRHPRFGSGRILDREGSGKHLKLTIDFAGSGPKKILPAYTQLEVER